jgi:ferredoxin-type protein NapF
MNKAISRRGLLTGKALNAGSDCVMRPPWAKSENIFIALCTRCDACINQCEQGIIIKGSGGYPEINFSRGECTFCERCEVACETSALDKATGTPWNLVAKINAGCFAGQGIECRSCDESCPSEAIRFRPVLGQMSQPEVKTSLCTACGACASVCPANAINMVTPTGQGQMNMEAMR